MTKIITHPEPMTPAQKAKALLPEELPHCIGNPGVECPHPIQPVMISGYDDKMRCPACNKVHVALVEQEAGNSSNPNTAPRFISAKLNTKAEQLERQRILKENEPRGGRTRPSPGTLDPGDVVDMKDLRQRDEHGTQEEGISDKERRKRIRAKYSKGPSRSM